MFKKQVKSCVIVLMAIILCMAALPGYEAAAATQEQVSMKPLG